MIRNYRYRGRALVNMSLEERRRRQAAMLAALRGAHCLPASVRAPRPAAAGEPSPKQSEKGGATL
jgi:hypothetical protein